MRGLATVGALAALLTCAVASPAGAAGITNNSDDLRTGWYPGQASLSPQLVSGGTFGRLFDTAVVGQVYAQPLVAAGTLLVATEYNRVYGLDPGTGAKRWERDLGTPWNVSDLGCNDLLPHIGVTGTPVVDPATNTAYMFAKTYANGSSGSAAWDLHALDVTNGNERPGFPVRIPAGIAAQNNPSASFHPTTQLQRPGLLLQNGVVYAAFGAHCDIPYYQGWVFGINASSGAIKARWVSRGGANESGAGIWQAGSGIASDGNGQLLVTTGNSGSPPSGTPGSSPPADLAESFIRLTVQPDGSLRTTDFFAPWDSTTLDTWDADFGSGGPMVMPPSYFGTASFPKLALAVGKQGYLYMLDLRKLGGIGMGPSGSDDVIRRIGPDGGVWSKPAVFPTGAGSGYVYVPTGSGGATASGSSGTLNVYSYGKDGSDRPNLIRVAQSSDAFGFSSGQPVVTSNGTDVGSGLVWVIWAPNGSGSGAQLRAYDAVPSGGRPVLRWSSPIGTSSKFAPPGVAGNRVYVGTRDGEVMGFGSPVAPPLSGSMQAFPTTTVGSTSRRTATFTANQAVTVTGVTSSDSRFSPSPPTLPVSLNSGDTLSVPVDFTPTSAGPAGGTLSVQSDHGPVQLGMTGTGKTPGAALSLDPPVVSFPGARPGDVTTGAFTIANSGGSDLTLNSVTPSGGPFTVDGGPSPGDVLAPGDRIAVSLRFSPQSAGEFSGQLSVHSSAGTDAIGLSGTATEPPQLHIEPASLSFGDVMPGASTTSSFVLSNPGGGPLTIMKSKPPSVGPFRPETPLDEGTTIPAGASRTLTVRFAPQALGTVSDAWVITGNDDSGVHTVAMSGSGVLVDPQQPGQPSGLGVPGLTEASTVVAAKVQSLSLRPSRFRVAPSRSGHAARRYGTAVRFRLSRATPVRFRIERGASGRRVVAVIDRAGRSGANAFSFSGRPGGHPLRRGTYRLVATPAGGASRSVSFEILPSR
ncbi:MAG: choice-of-anchor D domain-containing protein [Thermoleophilaceae bacterium]